jgi:hypothetical protein
VTPTISQDFFTRTFCACGLTADRAPHAAPQLTLSEPLRARVMATSSSSLSAALLRPLHHSDADNTSYSFDAECWPAELDKERGALAS